jgi:hypothetical protein
MMFSPHQKEAGTERPGRATDEDATPTPFRRAVWHKVRIVWLFPPTRSPTDGHDTLSD